MILRKSALLSAVLSASTTSAYFAQVANAHVEFVASNNNDSAPDAAPSAAETVDSRSSLSHSSASSSLWSALEGALEQKSELGFAAPKIMGMFEGWVTEFGREYESVEEKSKRMLVWLENHVMIETHNAKEDVSFTMGHNEYSDLTHAEFRERMKIGEFSPGLEIRGGKREFNFMQAKVEEVSNSNLRGVSADSAVERRLQGVVPTPDVSDEFTDWHEKGLMGPIRNQGVCGACWAFSAIGSIESAMAIDKYGKMTPGEQEELLKAGSGNDLGLVVPLSEQDLIDCDVLYEKGCQGGLMTTTFEEEEHKQGICSEADYPFIATQGTCSTSLCTPVPGSIVKDHVDIVPRKNNALVEAVKVQPTTAAMVATDPMFQFYSSGIFSTPGCGRVTKSMGDEDCNMLYEGQDTCLPDINHGVLVVGYGKDDTVSGDVKEFFKVKNSWGEAWGEGGYFRLARYEADDKAPEDSWGECAILTLLSYPVMEGQA